MPPIRIPDDLALDGVNGTILLVVLDGLGGIPHPRTGLTELETARTPNLDALAARSSLGMLSPVAPGITPGSGPAHLALFGYDPIAYDVGRGLLSALGVGFDVLPGDVAVRLNLATLDAAGVVTDRRAGRPSDEEGRRIVHRLSEGVSLGPEVRFFLLHEKEHRAVLVLRAPGLGAQVSDTDPQVVGRAPLEPVSLAPGSEETARLMKLFLEQARVLLQDEPSITGILARGFDRFEGLPSIRDRFRLEGTAVACYPMYRGAARLVGMEIPGAPTSDGAAVELLERTYGERPFHFLHFKSPDARGEDGDFDGKVAAIERIDGLLAPVIGLDPDVLVVTGDHSTPAGMGVHSWHHVPVLLASRWARPTAAEFSERVCRVGDLGMFESRFLMSLALAHAGRLAKFGA